MAVAAFRSRHWLSVPCSQGVLSLSLSIYMDPASLSNYLYTQGFAGMYIGQALTWSSPSTCPARCSTCLLDGSQRSDMSSPSGVFHHQADISHASEDRATRHLSAR